MLSKRLKRHMPSVDKVREVKAFGLIGAALFHPGLWHLNRRSAADGFAVGPFCGLTPGPLQMISAGIVALFFRVKLPVALPTTLYTNPLTIVPLYFAAYKIGPFALGATTGTGPEPPPDWVGTQPVASAEALGQWMIGLGAPLALGLCLLTGLLALCGYIIVRLVGSIHLLWAWAARRKRRASVRA